jgi:hypothetical protein
MFGGVGKAGWATILAASGLMLGSSIPAQAADLGGDCCADLEERIADLEATTARKGNGKVKLTVYGKVNEGVIPALPAFLCACPVPRKSGVRK